MITVPLEIAELIVAYVYKDRQKILDDQREVQEVAYVHPNDIIYSKYDLLRLRSTTRSFQAAVDRRLFKDFKITKLWLLSLVRTKELLNSFSICSSIRNYTFSPRVCLIRPIVRRNAWDYYGELADGCRREPRYSALLAEHTMRTKIAQHYDEQLKMLGLHGWSTDWIWLSLQRLLRGSEIGPQTTKLKAMPYFSSIHKLINLRKLSIGYSAPQGAQDSRIHYLIKNDISAGLATMLCNAPAQLASLIITYPTLTDIRNLLLFMSKSVSVLSLPQIKSLEVILGHETLIHRGCTIQTDHQVHAHTTGGKPISDLLNLLPSVESLKLSYSQEFHNAVLVLQKFDPPTMEHLRVLELEAFAVEMAVLLRLTARRPSRARKEMFDISIRRLAAFSQGLSWSEIVKTWQRNRSSEVDPDSVYTTSVRGPLWYLNREICTDEALSNLVRHETEMLDDLTSEDSRVVEFYQ